MIKHHPAEEMLLDFAAGAMSEGAALAVASHVTMCGSCRGDVAVIEAVGGALLESTEGEATSAGILDRTLAMLDMPDASVSPSPPLESGSAELVPEPLLHYIGRGLSHLAWRRVAGMATVEEARLPLASRNIKVALMRLKAGSLVPKHSHRGNEFTLVLAGGFSDGAETYGPGDFAARDASHTHKPVVDDDADCLCLVVLDAPLRLSGAVGTIVNPFLRI